MAHSFLAAINQPDGGFTFRPGRSGRPLTGFALSVDADRERVLTPAELDARTLAAFVRANHDLLRDARKYVGAWHDPHTGLVYVDVSTVVSDRATAERDARAANQLAYFDFAAGRSISLQ